MDQTLQFRDILRLIEDRSAAFRTAVAAAPGLATPVPSCPGWTVADLVQHMGEGRRRWAAIVAAGPATAPPDRPAADTAGSVPGERAELLAWFDASTQAMLEALHEAGPGRRCWTWWEGSQSPQTCGAVARHQLQEIAVHTYDAQLAVGTPQPLPARVALDGVDEFLSTCCATTAAWPHDAAVVDYHADEGASWRLRLSADGARVARIRSDRPDSPGEDSGPERDDAPAVSRVSARGPAGTLVQVLYGRLPITALTLEGDSRLLDLLAAWDPDAS